STPANNAADISAVGRAPDRTSSSKLSIACASALTSSTPNAPAPPLIEWIARNRSPMTSAEAAVSSCKRPASVRSRPSKLSSKNVASSAAIVELSRLERLDQPARRAGGLRDLLLLRIDLGGQHQDRRELARGVRAHLFHERE